MTIISTTMSLAEAVTQALEGQRCEIRCPAHEDHGPSLSVGPGSTQPVALHCHAGCQPEDILSHGGIEWSDVCTPREDQSRVNEPTWTPAGNASNIYPYRLANGHVEFEVLRVPQDGGKTFRQRHYDAATQRFVWSIEDCTRVLYRLPEILSAVGDGKTIHITEGERDVHTLLGLDLDATCNPGGAGKWRDEYAQSLAGANVVIYSDSDRVGQAHARSVRESLQSVDCTVRVLEPPAEFKDVTAFLQSGGTLDQMLVVTPENEPEQPRYGTDILALVGRTHARPDFVIDGTLAKGERCIITGLEGHGKTTLLRQIAVQVAAGIHPFSLRDMQPRRVLAIDCENHPSQTTEDWVHLVGLARRAGHGIEAGMLTVLEEWNNDTLDLTSPAGMAWLHERINAYRPDLVVMGPLTNMAARDLKDDEVVRRLKLAVNSARSICNSAFIMEHHAPHRHPMDKVRALRPYGSSLFLKWPDYCYGLRPIDEAARLYEFEKLRWPRVRNRAWPDRVRNGRPHSTEWMWLEAEPE